MIAAPGVSEVLATGGYLLVDLVTLTIKRGHVWQFDANGLNPVKKEILDSVRWTSAPRELRTSEDAPGGAQLFKPLSKVAYKRSELVSAVGAEVVQIGMTVTGTLPVTLSTEQDGSGAFSTTLGELALLGMLEGAWLTIDQGVVLALPETPASAGKSYGVLSPDPVRKFGGIVRGVTPTSYGVEFNCCDPLILGGGSVPRNLFSPLCRWEFADGTHCPVQRMLGTSKTHIPIAGVDVVFESETTVKLNPSVVVSLVSMAWCSIVPLDGPMMGMRFQVGSWQANGLYGARYDFADRLPWTWRCNQAHLEAGCSKAWGAQDESGDGPWGCANWNVSSGSQEVFGGFPDMPQPEST